MSGNTTGVILSNYNIVTYWIYTLVILYMIAFCN